MATVDLNCDLGEGYGDWRMGDDAAMLRIVTSVNVACGFHAGDPQIMAGTFAVVEIATEVFIASMAHRISPWLRRVGRRFNQACGGVFVAIGVALPLRS